METTKTLTLDEAQLKLIIDALQEAAWQARTYDYHKKDQLEKLIREIENTEDDF